MLAGSRLSLGDLEQGPFDVKLQALDLELDERIFERLPTESQALWRSILPKGRTSLGRAGLVLLARRASAGQPLELSLELDCQDVSIQPVAFPYCFEHVRGKVRWAEGKVELALRTVIGGQPLTAAGSIVDPTGKPRAALEFAFGTLPIDQALLDALPADTRQIVRDFQPAGTIHGSGRVVLDPELGPEPRVSAALSLDGVREMRWSGMRYPVRKLSGRLLIEPESWTFEELRGENGHARLAASGRVDVLAPGQFAVDLRVSAQHLKFDRELRDALPRPWQWSWGILNPVGSSNVEAHVVVRPGQEDQYRIRITPDDEDETRLHLALTPVPGSPGSVSGRLQLPPMEQVRGTFDFDNGTVRMQDVTFTFREAPVRFGRGEVVLKETGEFDLKIRQLGLRKLRLDAALRRIMPGMMGGFAELLDDGKGFTARAELLGISWSGNPLEPAVCTWDQATVDFLGNTIKAGVPLEQLQGRISGISGSSDGRQISTQGLIELDNVVIENQQLTEVRTPIVVADGWVRLSRIEAMLLGGTLEGALAMRFEDTPSFQGGLTLRDASLENLARTLPGRQDFTGRFSGWLDVSGRGSDLRSLRGRGGARVLEADLGQLPVFLRLIKPLNLSREKSAFDRADVSFTIEDGLFALDPIKFTGNTISLQGRGTIDPSGELEARFMPLYGRDERMHIPGISDVTREASGQILAIQARGPIMSPQFKLEVAPTAARMAGQMARFLTGDRDNDAPRPPESMPRGPISEMVVPRR
jgi:hypothetical protein